jgi:hypothetical protein
MAATQATFYVAPTGADQNPGTLAEPLRTIRAAQSAVRAVNKNMSGDILVYLRGGTYNLSRPIIFNASDSGTNGHMIRYLAYEDEVPVISGGYKLTGWKRYRADIYEAHLDRTDKLRQLYVNGQRAFMARGKDFSYSTAVQGYGKFTITGHEAWAMDAGVRFAGYTFLKNDLGRYKDAMDVELCSQAGFGYHTIGLSSIRNLGTKRVAILQEPIGAIAQSVPQDGGAFVSDKPELDAVSIFHFQNAFELLHTAGQFYFDRSKQVLFYYRRANEDMSRAKVIVPVSEELLILKGSSRRQRVANIEFRGITFEYSHYPLTKVGTSHGDTAIQSIALFDKYLNSGDSTIAKYRNTDIQSAAIECENSDHIDFTTDVFKHLGAVGLSLGNDSSHSHVIGNVFEDIGSSGISVGNPKNVYIGDGDFPPVVEEIPTGDIIENNYLRGLSVETLQAPGVAIFYTKNLEFSHNEVYDAPYTGVSLGWGWVAFIRITLPRTYSQSSGDNKIDYNMIDRVMLTMHDGAGIYVLGEQPGSEIVGNYFGKIGGVSQASSIYLDQGSRYLTVSNNYSDNPDGWFFVWGKAAQVYNVSAENNYSSVVHGNEGDNLHDSPGFHNARSNPTDVDKQDKNSAGIQSRYSWIKQIRALSE